MTTANNLHHFPAAVKKGLKNNVTFLTFMYLTCYIKDIQTGFAPLGRGVWQFESSLCTLDIVAPGSRDLGTRLSRERVSCQARTSAQCRSGALEAHQAHNLKVTEFDSCLRHHLTRSRFFSPFFQLLLLVPGLLFAPVLAVIVQFLLLITTHMPGQVLYYLVGRP